MRARSETLTTIGRFLERHGLATLLALFLVWWLTGHVNASLDRIDTQVHDHVSATTFYLRAICLNVAQDDRARQTCQPEPPR
jgi:hypothetical protein